MQGQLGKGQLGTGMVRGSSQRDLRVWDRLAYGRDDTGLGTDTKSPGDTALRRAALGARCGCRPRPGAICEVGMRVWDRRAYGSGMSPSFREGRTR